jgi:hypothetical protein
MILFPQKLFVKRRLIVVINSIIDISRMHRIQYQNRQYYNSANRRRFESLAIEFQPSIILNMIPS